MKKIDFYFDFLSPFSYFAWIRHKDILDLNAVSIDYKPVLMGRLFSHFEFPGPGEIMVKRNYELKKCFRYASLNNIPFSPPKSFPFNPLAIIRLALKNTAGDEQERLIDLLFKKVWAESTILEDPEIIEKLLQENNFRSDLYECSFGREAKLELKANIKEAIGRDIFGVPSLFVDQEYFWGNDSLESLQNYLVGNDSWNKELYSSLVNK